MQLDNAIAVLEKTLQFFNLKGFESCLVTARTLAEELDMSPDEICIAAEAVVYVNGNDVDCFHLGQKMNQYRIPLIILEILSLIFLWTRLLCLSKNG